MVNPHYNLRSAESPPRVSVVIRCYNEERHIGRLLEGLLRQTITEIEVIVVDSGSTDATLAIASRYPTKRVSIPKAEFSFGRSLNLGCSEATGDIIVAVSAHCYPVYEDWLEKLIEPFANPDVAMAYGKQRGNEHSRFSERQIYLQWFGEESDFVQRHPFANNANSAFRREIWQSLPFDETLTGLEDLDWAHKTMRNGYRIAYVAEAGVIHVHEENWPQVYNRYRREAIAMRRILPQERFTLLDLVRLCFAGVWGDLRAAWTQGELRREVAGILVFRCCQYIGTYHGYSQRDLLSQNLRETFYYPGERPTTDPAKPLAPTESAPISYVNGTSTPRRKFALDGCRIHDISVSVVDAPVWPGDDQPKIVETTSLAEGGEATVSNLSMCVHTGSHVDAPAHFLQNSATMADIPLERFIGSVVVLDMGVATQIGKEELENSDIPPGCQRLLFKTANGKLLETGVFAKDYVALSPEGAAWIKSNGIALVGIDYASIEAFGEKENQTHKILLGSGVVVLEGLDLRDVAAGQYEMVCLPLKLGETEGSPARVVLLESGSVG